MFGLSTWNKFVIIVIVLMLLFSAFLLTGQWKELGKLFYPLPYREDIFRYSRQFDLDPYFIAAVMRVESRYYSKALSKRGARGLMQLMPETARWVAGQMNIEYNDELLYQPDYNIQLGCWYLANLLVEFQGNFAAVLAAYNGGRGRVARWLDEGTWDGRLESTADIPFPETRTFVDRVWRDYQIYRHIYN
ncbi:lytic transglycosylase domain-containing protein [Metallumcola ferriviriculae]|uniref:Lytic transglycosylase domain-containing protein n=1 Tax=Metallumcola ferriviriculae TaxID=3039180 RepID=A0AAU0UKT9_9FIRM|nr:lytic transglycosylase domain-containing protein [Desulfitibacteraceae bacterium MK1]